MISWGLRRTEDIINAASQSSRIPLLEKDAAMGMVPYIQRGEAIPRADAATMPSTPNFLSPKERKVSCTRSLRDTATREPMTMPSTQYQKIWRNWISK